MVKLKVVDIPQLNLLGMHTIKQLDIDVNQLLKGDYYTSVYTISPHADKEMEKLQEDCSKLSTAFLDLFKPELGCLKGVELEIAFKPDSPLKAHVKPSLYPTIYWRTSTRLMMQVLKSVSGNLHSSTSTVLR